MFLGPHRAASKTKFVARETFPPEDVFCGESFPQKLHW
jgi:hypothetical protein